MALNEACNAEDVRSEQQFRVQELESLKATRINGVPHGAVQNIQGMKYSNLRTIETY